MSVLRSAMITAASLLLGAGIPMGGNNAIAGETYVMTTLADEAAVTVTAFGPDGALVLTAAEDGAARIRDTASGSDIALLEGLGNAVHHAGFSPDGARVVTVSTDNTVSVWDAASGREIATLKSAEAVYSAAINSDRARIVTASDDGLARIWDVDSGRAIALLIGHTDNVLDAAFSPDGARIVTASRDRTARLWDAASAREIAVLKHPDIVRSVAFSPDGMRLVTGANDGRTRIFDAAGGSEIAVFEGHTDDVLDANFSADGARVVTASYDRSARIWDAGSGQEIAVLTGHLGEVYSATFSPDGQRILTAARDGTWRIWTKLAAGGLPEGAAGLWYQNFMAPEPMPEDIVERMCVMNPGVIHGDGLVVIFVDVGSELPEASMHMRCTAEPSCQVFAGAPAQGLAVQGAATLNFSGDAGNICVEGECTNFSRCPAPAWTDEERASGFADAWEAHVLAAGK